MDDIAAQRLAWKRCIDVTSNKSARFFCRRLSRSYPSGNPFPNPVSSICSRVVDIFNGLTRTWSTAQLSAAREKLAATSLPGQGLVLFAGGSDYYCTGVPYTFTLNHHSLFARPPVTYAVSSFMFIAIVAPPCLTSLRCRARCF